jgi:hypothetical protein
MVSIHVKVFDWIHQYSLKLNPPIDTVNRCSTFARETSAKSQTTRTRLLETACFVSSRLKVLPGSGGERFPEIPGGQSAEAPTFRMHASRRAVTDQKRNRG